MNVSCSVTKRKYATDRLEQKRIREKLYSNDGFIERLSQETELSGHNGCVNCLEWTSDGALLASGSDDLTVRIWEPLHHRQVKCFQTGHQSNIFSVKFLHNNGNRVIATAAADGQVRIHNVEQEETLNVYNCHRYHRVKRLAVSPVAPSLIWSCGEDGNVRVLDMRQRHSCSSNGDSGCGNVCVNLNGENISSLSTNSAQTKSIDISPSRPYLAVGGNDQYVRIFDLRMLKSCAADFIDSYGWGPRDEPSTFYCVPGHISTQPSKSNRKPSLFESVRSISSTFVSFNQTGSELLVNLGSEQIYLFDMESRSVSSRVSIPRLQRSLCSKLDRIEHENGKTVLHKNGIHNGFRTPSNGFPSQDWVALKGKANDYFYEEKYTDAIACYSRAIELCDSKQQFLYANRALAFIKRKWTGDTYAALRDCQMALSFDSSYPKAHLRLLRCLVELGWNNEASEWSEMIQTSLPCLTSEPSFTSLLKDIEAKNAKASSKPSSNKTESGHLTEQELNHRRNARDYKYRYCGHCNAATDIKEANFFGSGDGKYVVAGSDDGSFFFWDKSSTNLVRILIGDESIVNCLQPNPVMCMLASSGIDSTVKLWSPGNPHAHNPHLRTDLHDVASANQKRLKSDPMEMLLFMNNPFFQSATGGGRGDGGDPDEDYSSGEEEQAMPDSCRTS